MEHAETGRTSDALQLLGGRTYEPKEAPKGVLSSLGEKREPSDKDIEELAAATVKANGGTMPIDAPSLAGDEAMAILSQITSDACAVAPSRFADNYEQLMSLCSALVMENLQLKKKANDLVLELFRLTLRPSGSTGMTNFAGRA